MVKTTIVHSAIYQFISNAALDKILRHCINTQVENAACCTLVPYPYDTYFTTQNFNTRDSSFDKRNICLDALAIQIRE
jgi:hypothetical protein